MTDEKKRTPRLQFTQSSFPGHIQINEQVNQNAESMPLPDFDTMTREEIRQMIHEIQVKQIEADLQIKHLRAQLEEKDAKAELFRIINENMLDMIALTDLEGNLLFAGQSCGILGYNPGFLTGKNLMDFVHPEDLPRIIKEFGEFVASGQPRIIECRILCSDGTYLWLETTGNFIKDKNRAPQKIVISSRNITERKHAEDSLKKLEWMLSDKALSNDTSQSREEDQGYGDLTEMNLDGIILQSIGREGLKNIARDYLDLLSTSSAIYEVNGDYAFGIFSSGWCRMMDRASRQLCNTLDNAEALNSGSWLCHESCWTDCSQKIIAKGLPMDIECNGGIRLYGVPIFAGGQVVGTINFGYGDPPKEPEKLRKLSEAYHIKYDDLVYEAHKYDSRPPFIIELAKKRLHASARIIGSMIETKQAEQALKESEKKHRRLFETMAQGVIYQSADGQIISANPAAQKILGLTFNQIKGMTPMDPHWKMIDENSTEVPGPDHPAMIALRTGKSIGPVIRGVFHFKKKHHVWLSITTIPLFQPGEAKPFQVYSTFEDITARKNAERQIETEAKLRNILLDNIPNCFALILKKQSHEIVASNKAAAAIGAVPGKICYHICAQRDDRCPFCLAPELWVTNEFQEIETEYRGKWYKGVWAPFSSDLYLHYIFDITESKRAEKELMESEFRFKALHNASFGGIAIHDQGVILECNQGLTEITGFDYDELIGMDGLLLVEEKSRKAAMDNILSGYEKPYEAIGVRKNGEQYPVRLEARNIPYKGKTARVVEFRDITEQKQADNERLKLQEQLNQAQKMESVGRLAGGVAHDFNNKLSIINGYSELAIDMVDPSNPLRETIQEIYTAGKQSAGIVRQLLAFARKQTISPVLLDLNDTISRMLKMLQRLIGENIDLAWYPGRNIWPVKIDPSQVDQIMANLAVNARDAISDVGKLIIETKNIIVDDDYCKANPEALAGRYVMLAVSDDGCGIKKELMDQLFEPYYTTKGVGKGTGLGLPTIYGIVKQNKGFINVYSELGEGATFKIYLPSRKEWTSSLQSRKESSGPIPTGTETVLVVEDEKTILQMSRHMLQRLGYSVETARNPVEALQVSKEFSGTIHLLLTDVVMPEMNGRDLSTQLAQTRPGIKTLYMSGYTANVIAHHGVLNEGVQFIQKPFSMKRLAVKIREVLEQK